jgi:organic hydroperoxide reductase OsmC/OhrA
MCGRGPAGYRRSRGLPLLRPPKALGGEGGGTNPEQLFTIGYAACLKAAMLVLERHSRNVDLALTVNGRALESEAEMTA